MKNIKRNIIMLMAAAGMVLSVNANQAAAADKPKFDIPPEVAGDMAQIVYAAHQMPNSLEKVKRFADIAVDFNEVGLTAEASGIFNQAFTLTMHLATSPHRSNAYRYIAESYRKLGMKDEALSALALSIFEAHKMWNSSEKAGLFMAVADEFSKMNMMSEAMGVKKQANLILSNDN